MARIVPDHGLETFKTGQRMHIFVRLRVRLPQESGCRKTGFDLQTDRTVG